MGCLSHTLVLIAGLGVGALGAGLAVFFLTASDNMTDLHVSTK